jgi:hypothetical protein
VQCVQNCNDYNCAPFLCSFGRTSTCVFVSACWPSQTPLWTNTSWGSSDGRQHSSFIASTCASNSESCVCAGVRAPAAGGPDLAAAQAGRAAQPGCCWRALAFQLVLPGAAAERRRRRHAALGAGSVAAAA